jgi:hypothetical protein
MLWPANLPMVVLLELLPVPLDAAPKVVLLAPEDIAFKELNPNPVLFAPELMLAKEFRPKAVLVKIALLPLPNLSPLTVDACNVAIITYFQV